MPTRPHRRRARPLAALALAALLGLTGCGLADPGARARDLGQVLHLGLGGSLVPGFHVWGLVPLLGTSLGYSHDSAWVGSDYGYTLLWRQAGYGALLGGEMVRSEFPYPVSTFWRQPLWDAYLTQGQLMFMHLAVTDQRLGKDAQAIVLRRAEVGLHLLWVGVSLGLDLVHLFDALVGFGGWDPSGDDHTRPAHAPFWRPDRDAPAAPAPEVRPPVDSPPPPWQPDA